MSEQGFPLFNLPLHIIEEVVSKLALCEMVIFKRCSRQARQIVHSYWQRQRSLKTSADHFHQLYPYIDTQKPQFKSMFHIRNELGKYMCMLPENRLLEADFSGLQRYHHEMMESILMKFNLDAHAIFSSIVSISFAQCLVSCADLESLSYYTQNLKSLTISDRLIDQKLEGDDACPEIMKCYRTSMKRGLIGHRSKMILYVKTLWPGLAQLTFSDKTLILDERTR